MIFAPDATPTLLSVTSPGSYGGAGDERPRWDLLVSRIEIGEMFKDLVWQ
jgi:hypothetical protein